MGKCHPPGFHYGGPNLEYSAEKKTLTNIFRFTPLAARLNGHVLNILCDHTQVYKNKPYDWDHILDTKNPESCRSHFLCIFIVFGVAEVETTHYSRPTGGLKVKLNKINHSFR